MTCSDKMPLPLLTICMPTYNRIRNLEKTLAVILPWCIGKDQVELAISDNGSSDGTGEYLMQVQKVYPQIRLRLNETNRGFSRNVLDCMSMATGEYIHFTADDDLPDADAFDHLVALLATGKPDAVISNYHIRYCRTDTFFQALPKESASFDRIEALLAYVGHHVTFMSTITFRRTVPDPGSFFKFEGLAFMHLAVLLDAMAGKRGTFLYDSIPLVVATDENAPNYCLVDLFSNLLIRCFEIRQDKLDIKELLPFFRSVALFLGGSGVSTRNWYGRDKVLRRLCGWRLFFDWRFVVNVLALQPMMRATPAWLRFGLARMVHRVGLHPIRSISP
ncbi:MAG: glycosyltransferase family 2 protein [Deltaproteobacteria bacterium]|nr:glycosyltransferase family 2 protein [Deltaproteobacteria bacterium]